MIATRYEYEKCLLSLNQFTRERLLDWMETELAGRGATCNSDVAGHLCVGRKWALVELCGD